MEMDMGRGIWMASAMRTPVSGQSSQCGGPVSHLAPRAGARAVIPVTWAPHLPLPCLSLSFTSQGP